MVMHNASKTNRPSVKAGYGHVTGQAREEKEEEVTMMETFTLRCAQDGLNTH